MRKQQASKPATASKQTVPKYGMAQMPRDSLAGRMQQRGTLQTSMQHRSSLAQRMQERGTLPISSDPSRMLPMLPPTTVPRIPPMSSSISAGSNLHTSPWTLTPGGLPDKSVVPKATPPSSSAKRLSVGQRFRKSLAVQMRAENYRPKRRKVGKQRPSFVATPPPAATTYKPRRRKNGKQRPSIVFQSHNHTPTISLAELKKQEEQIGRLMEEPVKKQEKQIGRLMEEPMKKQEEQIGCLMDEPVRKQGASRPKRKQNAPSTSCITPCSGESKAAGENEAIHFQTLDGPSELFATIPLEASKRCEDNYDISDYEEDAKGKRIEPNRKGKRVPSWSLKYKELAKTQADVDPESIFGSKVPRCDLDLIFPDSLYTELIGWVPVKRARGDSGYWFKDRVTRTESAAYKRRTGQTRTCLHL